MTNITKEVKMITHSIIQLLSNSRTNNNIENELKIMEPTINRLLIYSVKGLKQTRERCN